MTHSRNNAGLVREDLAQEQLGAFVLRINPALVIAASSRNLLEGQDDVTWKALRAFQFAIVIESQWMPDRGPA